MIHDLSVVDACRTRAPHRSQSGEDVSTERAAAFSYPPCLRASVFNPLA